MAKSNDQKVAWDKQQYRDIVKEIENFGVTEEQKIDIMYFLAMNLNDNKKMKSICNFLENYINKINNEADNKNIQQNKKIILT